MGVVMSYCFETRKRSAALLAERGLILRGL
jgi:hypothetical protein